MQFNVSQTTAQLTMKAVKVMSDIATFLSVESGEEEPTRSKTGPNVETTVVQFTDDLRTGEFKYITENMGQFSHHSPTSPPPSFLASYPCYIHVLVFSVFVFRSSTYS